MFYGFFNPSTQNISFVISIPGRAKGNSIVVSFSWEYGIINEVKSGCKMLALFLHGCKMVAMATVPVKDPGQGKERRHSTSVSPLC